MLQKTFYPRAVEGFLVETLDDEIVLLHPGRNLIIHSNQTGALIWQLCDGQRTLEEIVELLSRAYPAAEAEIANDVPHMIEMLMEHGALTTR